MSLHITAGPLPDLTTHKVLKPNTPQKVETPLCTTEVTLFLPPSQFLSTHRPNNPFSLVIRTTFHRSIASEKLFFSTEFPTKIAHLVPPGFSLVEKSARWFTGDPGMEWDVYADEPWIKGWAVTSFNTIQVGDAELDQTDGVREEVKESWKWVTIEGSEVPSDPASRKKLFARHSGKGWVIPEETQISWEFTNSFLDFERLKLRLPGFEIDCKRFWGGKALRYVLSVDEGDGNGREIIVCVAFGIVEDGKVDGGKVDGKPAVGGDGAEDGNMKEDETGNFKDDID